MMHATASGRTETVARQRLNGSFLRSRRSEQRRLTPAFGQERSFVFMRIERSSQRLCRSSALRQAVCQLCEHLARRCRDRVEARATIGALGVDAVEEQHVKMNGATA
jgi:hypothetical protein